MEKTASWLFKSLSALVFPQRNACHLCGRGLAAAGEGILCAQCANGLLRMQIHCREQAVGLRPPLSVCVSAYWYQDEPRALVHRLKYGADRSAALPLAHGMCAAFAKSSAKLSQWAELLIPVPTLPSREKQRGYNQALLLAREVGACTGLPILPNTLVRVSAAKSQALSTRDQRLAAMRNAFVAMPSDALRGKRVLLLDDVLTTGATATACAEALLFAGADTVILLTACRA